MKSIKLLIAITLCATTALAQEPAFNNEANTAKNTTAGNAGKLASDRFGHQIPLVLSSYSTFGLNDTAETGSTTTTINATAHNVKVGNYVLFGPTAGSRAGLGYVTSVATNSFTITPPLPNAPNNGDFFFIGSPAVAGVDTNGQSMVNIRAANGTEVARAEDAAHTSGEFGFGVWGVRNDSGTTFAANGNYSPFSVNSLGSIECSLNSAMQLGASGGSSPVRAEDVASGDANALMIAGAVREDALTVNTGTSGDFTQLKADAAGRLISTLAPAGETFQSCGTATATTSDVAIKAAVASNRMYVTSITCKNTSATVATSLDFKDGSTVIAVGGISQMATAAPGAFTASFPVPLRGTSNTALNFATNVSVSSVTCCAAGYVSVN